VNFERRVMQGLTDGVMR